MALVLNDEQTMLRDTARVVGRAGPGLAHALSCAMRTMPPASRAISEELRRNGLHRHTDRRGRLAGSGWPCRCWIVLEEIGRNLPSILFCATAVAAVEALKERHRRCAPGSASLAGDTRHSCARDRRGRQATADPVVMKAERSGNGFRLSGKKQFVTHGHIADLIIVAARTAGSADDTNGIGPLRGRQGRRGPHRAEGRTPRGFEHRGTAGVRRRRGRRRCRDRRSRCRA